MSIWSRERGTPTLHVFNPVFCKCMIAISCDCERNCSPRAASKPDAAFAEYRRVVPEGVRVRGQQQTSNPADRPPKPNRFNRRDNCVLHAHCSLSCRVCGIRGSNAP